jgi:hypothetical protein
MKNKIKTSILSRKGLFNIKYQAAANVSRRTVLVTVERSMVEVLTEEGSVCCQIKIYP